MPGKLYIFSIDIRKMADSRLEFFCRALFSKGFFALVVPLRLKPDVVSVIWESLVSMHCRPREEFTKIVLHFSSCNARIKGGKLC